MLEKLKARLKLDKNSLLVAGGIALIVKLILTMGLPIYVIGDSAYDDNYFIRLAGFLAKGQWLGPYDKKTLLKRPMFAIYLSTIHKLNLSFKLSVVVFYVLGIIVFLLALRSVLQKKQMYLLMFVLMLYSPIMIHSMFAQRVYRMAIMPATIIMVVGCLIGLYFSLQQKKAWYKTGLWSVGTGFWFFFFWYMREDSIWLLPFFACALGVALINVIVDFVKNPEVKGMKAFIKSKYVLQLIWIVLPVMLFLMGDHLMKYQNYKYYGVYTDSEMNDSEFGKLMSAMYAVESEDEYEYVNLTHDTLEKIVAISPSLQSMQGQIEGMYDSGWTMENGQIAGGYITYAFRDALEKAGHYNNAVEKEAFCKQAREEIRAAMADGRLNTQEGLYSVSYLLGKKGANFDVLIPKFLESLKWVVTNERMQAGVLTSSGKNKTIRNFEIMTNDLAIYPPEECFTLVGYGFCKDDAKQIQFMIEREDGTKTEFVNGMASNDVFEYYINQGIIYENARDCRFSGTLQFRAEEALMLHILVDGEEVETLDLWQTNPTMVETDEYVYCFDTVGIESTPDALSESGGMIAKIDQGFIRLSQIFSIPVCLLGIVAYGYLIFAGFFSKKDKEKKAKLRELLLIITGILLSFLLVTGGVTYRYAEAINSEGRDFYLCSAYVMYQLFLVLVIWVDCEQLLQQEKTK